MLKPLSGKVPNSTKVILALLFCLSFSCEGRKNASVNSSAGITEESSQLPTDSVLFFSSYCLYQSAFLKDTGDAALIIFLDPQGKGDYPVRKYRILADSMPVIMAGSLKSKNGMGPLDVLPHIVSITGEIRNLHPKNKFQVFLAGFSGGGGMARALATKLPEIKGVIYAASPGNAVSAVPAMGFAGLGDPNFSDMQMSQLEYEKQGVPHCLQTWQGKHAWPDVPSMAFAFDWIKAGLYGGSFSSRLCARLRQSAKQEKNPLEKERLLQQLAFLEETLNQSGRYGLTELQSLRKLPGFLLADKMRHKEIQEELAKKEFYQHAFIEKDIQWWQAEVSHLKKRLPLPWKEQRILGYLSLLAYTFASRSISEKNLPAAVHFSQLYAFIDPENPEAFYLQAVAMAANGNQEACQQHIKKAISLGFSDQQRMAAQPEFSGLGLPKISQN